MCVQVNSLRSAETMPQLLLAPTFAIGLRKLQRQRFENLLAIFSALTSQNISVNAVANLPVQARQLLVNCHGRSKAGRFNQLANVF